MSTVIFCTEKNFQVSTKPSALQNAVRILRTAKKQSLKATIPLIVLLTKPFYKEKSSVFPRKCVYDYLSTEVVAFNFLSHDSDFSAMVIQISMLHLGEKREKTRKLVSTDTTSVLPALLNTKILWINIQKCCIKKKYENTCNFEDNTRATNSSDHFKI